MGNEHTVPFHEWGVRILTQTVWSQSLGSVILGVSLSQVDIMCPVCGVCENNLLKEVNRNVPQEVVTELGRKKKS